MVSVFPYLGIHVSANDETVDTESMALRDLVSRLCNY